MSNMDIEHEGLVPLGLDPMMSQSQQMKPKRKMVKRHQPGLEMDQLSQLARQKFLNFLNNFVLESDESQMSTAQEMEPFYLMKLRNSMNVDGVITLYVDWSHLSAHQVLQNFVESEFMRAFPHLRRAIHDFAMQHEEKLVKPGEDSAAMKKYTVGFYNMDVHFKLRQLKTDKIGQLTAVCGTVTRTSEVRPELISATFTCLDCGSTVKHIEQQFKYTLPTRCSNTNCHNTKKFQLNIKESDCADWQRIRLQESSEDIPAGSMPRSMDVILRDDVVEKCKPGDKCMFTGSLIPIPDVAQLTGKSVKFMKKGQGSSSSMAGLTGLKTLGVRSLNCKLIFLANSVVPVHAALGTLNIREEDETHLGFTDEEKQILLNMKNANKIYHNLAKSIAPNVFGHEDIKRGILLMLFGGVHKVASDSTKLRGDVNICIVGDPSTAKSQFLKFVTKLLPRTVYTSGKASTAAGLTAAVSRDPDTGEFGIEAGALMLADNGVCCIDEFDKMDPKDQAAIHEAMEQQTITLTKAGIQATLNARASILAAANPKMGRYDTTRSLGANVALTAPIMSRFDLFFVVVDECDEALDTYIAEHIVKLHKGETDMSTLGPYNIAQMQNYIRFARTVKPQLSSEAQKLLVRFYRQYRMQDEGERKAYRFTVRQLESMIRLSEALARVHLDEEVKGRYVREAARLLKQSIITVDQGQVDFDDGKEGGEGNVMSADMMDEETDNKDSKFVVKYEEYLKTANLIVRMIRREDEGEGVIQGDVEKFVINSLYKDTEFSTSKELIQCQEKLSYIIKRLVDIDHILLILQDNEEDEKKRTLEVHPNYDEENRYEIQDRKDKKFEVDKKKSEVEYRKQQKIKAKEEKKKLEEDEKNKEDNKINNDNVDVVEDNNDDIMGEEEAGEMEVAASDLAASLAEMPLTQVQSSDSLALTQPQGTGDSLADTVPQDQTE